MWKAAIAYAVIHAAIASAAETRVGRAARAFPETSEQIVVYADQLPAQLSDAQWKFVATHYAGGQKQTRSWVRTIRRLNPGFLMLHYQLAVGTGPARFLVGEEWTSDFDQVSKHEEWFLHDQGGHRLRQKKWDWYVMDIRFADNAPAGGFPQYWADAALNRMRANEDDGTFADSYTQDILMLQLEPGNFTWFSDADECRKQWLPNLNSYGAFAASRFAETPERFYFLPNLGGLVTGWDDVTKLDVGDGGMVEGFAAPEPGRSYSPDDWKMQTTRILSLARQDKIVLCQTCIDSHDPDARWFVICSHLLSKGRHSYLNMFEKTSLEWYPEYEVGLGAAVGELKKDVAGYWDPATKTFRREFAKGEVCVNPASEPATIKYARPVRLVTATGGGAVDAGGKAGGELREEVTRSVAVPGHSGRIVLYGAK